MTTQPAPDDAPRDSVRGLLAIALAWTAVVAILVAVHPTNAGGTASTGGGRTSFTIASVGGQEAGGADGASFRVQANPVPIELDITGTGEVECWNADTEDYDYTSGREGSVTLEVGLREGRNSISCTTFSVIPQVRTLLVTYEPDPNATPTPTPSPADRPTPSARPTARPAASGATDLFEITSIDGRHPGSAAGGTFTVHQPTVRIDIDQWTVATVSCENVDTAWYWETSPRVAAQFLEITLRPGTNTIICEAGKSPSQRERFEVEFVVDPTASPDPAAVVITSVDGWARNTIPAHGYTTLAGQVILRGSAPDPAAVVCSGAACEGQPVYATGATTWAVTLELAEGENRVEVHAADDPSNSDRITVEMVP